MSLAAYYNAVSNGSTVTFRPTGNSMSGFINSKDEVTVTPNVSYSVGDAVLCKVKGNIYLHKVTAIDPVKNRVQISNNHGFVNGWCSASSIVGKVTSINGKQV